MRFYLTFCFYISISLFFYSCPTTGKSNSFPYVEKEFLLPAYLVEKAFQYAPVVYQATIPGKNRFDFITTWDFDGDLKGNNNEEHLLETSYTLQANLTFSILETETHYFINYSIYHPLDWDPFPEFLPYSWHENDMENLQVVVQKNPIEKVILLAAQAHLST